MEDKKLILPNTALFVPGTPKPEADYLELERLGKKLGIPVLMMRVRVEARNPDGSPGEHYEGRSRTYNRNFWNGLFGACVGAPPGTATFGAGYLAFKDISAVVHALDYNLSNSFWVSPMYASGGESAGIEVGTGSAIESFEAYAMSAVVNNGNGAGQLSYQAQTAGTPTYNSGTKVWTAAVQRILNNNSGGTIVITETGLYGYQPANAWRTMFCRDLLGSSVSVLNAGQLTVTYTMTLTFPA